MTLPLVVVTLPAISVELASGISVKDHPGHIMVAFILYFDGVSQGIAGTGYAVVIGIDG